MLGGIDISVFNFINRTLANPVLDALMPFMTGLASGEFISALAVMLVIFGRREKKLAGIFLLAGLTLNYFVIEFLKTAAAVPRPFISIPDARLLLPKGAGFSFPSGHATTAFMAATLMSRFFKRNAIWFAIASLAAFSRIYVGAHYASDVVAGALTGMIVGYGLAKAADGSKVS